MHNDLIGLVTCSYVHLRPQSATKCRVAAGQIGDELDLRVLLALVENAPPVEAVDVLITELGHMLDAVDVSVLIANFSGDAVVRMSHVTSPLELADGRNERTESVPLEGSAYERVLFGQQLVIEPADDGWDVLVPVTERGDAIGVLELSLPNHPEPDVVTYLESAAHALAYVLVASRRHTDLYEWAQRDVQFSLAAEIQRRLLPSAYTLEAGSFTLAGWLEPAATVGGDTFDYSLDREYLYASITDAMGHGIDAALLATLTVGSLRNTRRSLASPAMQARTANVTLLENARYDQFVTGILIRLRLADGRLELINAGHPVPRHLRDGVSTALPLPPDPAFGMIDGHFEVHTVQLEPGDRLLFVTDGFLERNALEVDLDASLESTRERHPREIVRELAANVLRATEGNLRDDATVLCLDWYGPGAQRRAEGGASRARATKP